MNVLQIISSTRVSGAEKHAAVLSERLRDRGHGVTVMCPPGGWLPDRLRGGGLDTLALPMHGAATLAFQRSIGDEIRARSIDVIHAHLTCATYHAVVAGRRTGRPVVASAHVVSHDPVYRLLMPRGRNRIVAVSNFVRENLLRQRIRPDRISTIYNGTEFTEAVPDDGSELPVRAELAVPADSRLVGLFGHVGEFKGHPLLISAAPQILAAAPNTYFACVGPVTPAVQRQMWQLAVDHGVADRFRFTGVRSDVRRLMQAMDLITLPSHYEAFGIVLIEAMALGKPVVASRAGGIPELVEHGETGMLVERTPEALAASIGSILTDPATAARFGTAAAARARRMFTLETMATNMEALYAELTAAA